MKKVILFDLDDTLYDYESAHKKAINEVYFFLKKEIGLTRKKFLELFDLSKEEIKKELSEKLGITEEELVAIYTKVSFYNYG